MSPITPNESNKDRSAQRMNTMLRSTRGGGQAAKGKDQSKQETPGYVPEPLPGSDKPEEPRPPRFNPFEDSPDNKILDLSLPKGPSPNFKAVEIRFHNTKTVGTGSIRINNPKNNSMGYFDAVYLKSYPEGEDADYRIDPKTHKKLQRFALSARQSLLPELHRAAGILLLSSRIQPELTMQEVLAMPLDQNGYLNTCDPQAPVYSNQTCW